MSNVTLDINDIFSGADEIQSFKDIVLDYRNVLDAEYKQNLKDYYDNNSREESSDWFGRSAIIQRTYDSFYNDTHKGRSYRIKQARILSDRKDSRNRILSIIDLVKEMPSKTIQISSSDCYVFRTCYRKMKGY